MLPDIFSSFDPATYSISDPKSYRSILFWTFNFFLFLTIQTTLWLNPNRINTLLFSAISIIRTQSSRTTTSSLKGTTSILTALFPILILINLTGLIPYIFRVTSHLVWSLTFAVPMWLSFLISGATYSPISFVAGFLPRGAPDWLNPFLRIIEVIRSVLRPFTLSFRLTANITAGHVALALIAYYTANAIRTASFSLIPLIVIQVSYLLFEVAICLIQAYIFCLLLSLYTNDHPI